MKVINPNFIHIHKAYRQGKTGAICEGSSRSGKTWSVVDFIVWYAKEHNARVINIYKETYNSFKTTLYNDFNQRLPYYDIQSPFADKQEVSQFNLLGSKVSLLGADRTAGERKGSRFHGAGSDLSVYNEMLDIPQPVFDQSEMRCKDFWVGDYNPKFSSHWVYTKVCLRPDVAFLKTTFLDNPHIHKNEIRKILSYEPTHPDDRELEVSKRRPHPTNILEGTADDYMWNVYGLGLRSSPEGLIFQHVKWVKEFPDFCDKVFFGQDFGFTVDPSATVKLGVCYSTNSIYIKKLFYAPTESITRLLVPALEELALTDPDFNKKEIIWCDSANPGAIADLTSAKFKAHAVKKIKIMDGIAVLKNFKIHLVEDADFRSEQENYKFREVNGIKLDEPLDLFNHLWDAARYAAVFNLRVKEKKKN